MNWNSVWRFFGFGKTEAEIEAKAKAKAEKKVTSPIMVAERGNINSLQAKQGKLTSEWFGIVNKARQINSQLNDVNAEVKEYRTRLDGIAHEAELIQKQAEKILL